MSTPNNANEMFVQASRRKLRFPTSKGQLSVDDLWDLSLESLDKVAVALDEQLQKAGRKSFVSARTSSNVELELAFEVVKFVIETKLTEEAAKKVKADKASQKAFLNELLEKKKLAQMEGLSVEDIQKQLDALT